MGPDLYYIPLNHQHKKNKAELEQHQKEETILYKEAVPKSSKGLCGAGGGV